MSGERPEDRSDGTDAVVIAPGFDVLPVPVRTQVVSLTAELLPAVPGLTPALRKVAGFTPARRGRVGAAALSEALADGEFTAKVGVQAQAKYSERMLEVAQGPAATTAWASQHPAAAAALAWLVDPPTSTAWFEAAALPERDADGSDLQGLRDKIADLERQLRDSAKEQRAEQRAKLETLRVENADLRRKLGETRATLRSERAESEQRVAAAETAKDEAQRARELADTEVRRLRARVEEFHRRDAGSRSEDRAGREDESVRARLLLDTLMDAASGLRRELALPPLAHRPADRIADAIHQSSNDTTASNAPLITTAARLDQYLAAPGTHVILDGYNVTRSVWESTSLETQRTRLLALLPALAARTNAEVTVVFDAAAVATRPSVAAPRGVRVLFSPPQVIADDVIRDLVAAEPTGRPVLVVTADAAVLRDVRADGALTVSPGAMLHLLARDRR